MVRKLTVENVVLILLSGLFSAISIVSLHYKFSPIIFPVGKSKLWDTATEANIWTWANVFTLSAAGTACLAWSYASWKSRRPHWFGWLLVGCLVISLSFDDLVGFHERLDALGAKMGGGQGFLHFRWVVPGALIALAYLAALTAHAVRIAPRPRAYLLGGVCLFFAGAIGLEMISGASLSANGRTNAYIVLYHIEEMFEAIGAALMLCAPIAALPDDARRLIRVPQTP